MEDLIGIYLIVIICVGIFIALFFIFRELMCWYWKVNERVNLQKKANNLLEQILKQLGGDINYPPEKDSMGN